jgi:hypothetical protein
MVRARGQERHRGSGDRYVLPMSESASDGAGRRAEVERRVGAAADRGLAGVVAADPWVRGAATLARYGAASLVSVVLYPVLAGVLYVLLLIWATITDEPAGGPLALPFGVLLGALVGLVCTVLAVVACGVVELATLRVRLARPWLLLLSWAVLGALAVAVGAVTVAPLDGSSADPALTVAVVLAVAAPAGLVVGAGVQSGAALTSLALRAARRRVVRTTEGPQHPVGSGTA